MVSRRQRATDVVRTVIAQVSAQNVSFMAAGIAYHAFISLLPLLILVFFLVSALGDAALAAQVTATTEGFLPESANRVLAGSIEGSVATAGSTAIGLVTLLWGSLKIFRGLDTAFSEIYDTAAEASLLSQVRDGLLVFAALALALVAVAGATIVFAFVPELPFVGLLNPLLLVVGLTVAFAPMYYVFPDAPVRAREVLPGAVVAAVGWAALQALFQVYVSLVGDGASGGDALGALVLLLTWLYFGGFLLLVGAVLNAVLAGRLPVEDGESTPSGVGGGGQAPASSVAEAREDSRRAHLERRAEALARERDMFANDVAAQRSRRYALEDRNRDLRQRVARLEAENARLRERREHPLGWRLRRELSRLGG